MNKRPIPHNEKERLKALHSYELLNSLSEEEFDRITELASLICDVPIALVSLVDENRQWFKSKIGLDIDETPRELAFCQYTIMGEGLFEVEDAAKDERFEENELVTAGPKLQFYAGYPLIDPDGFALGTLCVIDRNPNKLKAKQRRSLQLLAEEVMMLIIERRRKEELRNFEKLFLFSDDLICITGADGNLKKVNPAFTKILGWDRQFLLETSFFEFIHPDDLELTRAELLKLTTGISTINFLLRIQSKDNGYRLLAWTVTPERSKDNLFAIGRDITDEKAREKELAISEEKLRAFFENSQGLMCTHDIRGNFLTVNLSGAAMLGYTTSEIMQMSLFDIIPKERHHLLEGYLLAIQAKGHLEAQMITRHKDGALHTWMFNNVLENNPGRDPYVIGNAIDITERQKIENELLTEKSRLAAFVKHAPAAVAMLDNDMRFVAVSNCWLEDYKLQDRDIIGMSYYEAFPNLGPESRQRHQRILNGAIEKKEGEFFTTAGTDQNRYITWEMRPWYKAGGAIGGAMVYTQNITKMVEQQEELKNAKILAEQASVAKSEFLANMSHEIRTPLNGVIGFTDLMLKTQLNEIQQQYLTIVNQSANALLSIINDILDFSKIEAGKLELEIEKCDLYELGAQATDIITYQIQTKGLEMLLNIPPDLPRFIWTDIVRLKQILINLLSNASKFTEHGEIELKIAALSMETDQVTMRFAVRDTGIGIKPDKQLKIFDAFSQEDGSTTKKHGGTGLGLTISNKLLGLMGSRLQLESTQGKGSIFYFDINLKAEQGEPEHWENLELIKNVLIVDDNANNRLILQEMLLLKGIESTPATNGLEALQMIAAGGHYDVILMDYHMPYMDGLETIRKIRENFYATADEQPIMLLYSSSDDEKVIRACEEFQVSHRMVKPIKMQDLYSTLSRLYKKAGALSETEPNQPKMETTQNRITILVAEDNAVNMLLARTIVRRIAPNAVLLEAHNGIEALNFCKKQLPDLILMDVQMPEMNGYEATEKIRLMERGTHVPIIALTAGNVKSEKEKCFASGMDDFIVKPVVEEMIATVMNKWLNFGQNKLSPQRADGSVKEEVHFDREQIRKYIGDDQAMMKEVIDLTRVELAQSLEVMGKQISARDMKGIKNMGHKLYGTAVSAGLQILGGIAMQLEKLEEFDSEQANSVFSACKHEISIILNLMA
ncbi:PAS domain S-box-containing protein [Mucilaginibacter sp. UYNi724]